MPRSLPDTSSSRDESYDATDSDAFTAAEVSTDDDAAMDPSMGGATGSTDNREAPAFAGPMPEHPPMASPAVPSLQIPEAFPDYPSFLEKNAVMALRELCFFFLAGHLTFHHENKRVSTAKYAAQRRSRGNQDPGDLYAYVYIQLDEVPAARLDTAYQALAELWNKGVPENDVAWLASVGSFEDPPKHVCLLHMDRMLRQSLRRHMDAASADHMAGYMVDYIRGLDLFYIPTLLALFPLLDDDGRLEFQQWFHNYPHRPANYDPPAAVDVAVAFFVDEAETHWRGPLEYVTGRFAALHCGETRYETPAFTRRYWHNRKRTRIACFKLRGHVPPGTCQTYAGLPHLSTAANLSQNCGGTASVSAVRSCPSACKKRRKLQLRASTGMPLDIASVSAIRTAASCRAITTVEWHAADLCLIPKPSKPMTGGVLLSIDLRQAFDVMPRSKLQEAMDLAKVDPAAQHVILQLHAHASLRVTHGSQVAMLDTDNGIRQGCAFSHIAFVLDTLEAFGMTISPGKSAVLIGVRGSKVGSILQKHVFKDPRKGKFLHCPTRHGTIRLPVVTQHPYLGAILSYQSMEALTLKERVRQSWSSFHRILPALRSNSVALHSRISVWQSCVFSTLMHGLDSVGLAPGGSIQQTLCASVYSAACYLSRHVKSQHAEAYVFRAAVLKWLDDRKTAILSPCQFCGADFKVFCSDCAPLMNRLLPLLLLQLSLKHLPPQAMETHMKDALRKEMAEVETQELMGAQEQANHDATFSGGTGAICTERSRAGQHQGEHASGRGCSDRSSPGRAGSHETQRDKRTAENAAPAGKGNGDQEKWPRPSAKGSARTSDDGWQRGHSSQAPSRRRTTQDRSWSSREWPNRQDRQDRHDRSDRKWNSDTDRDKELMNLCLSMGRLLQRHEDQFGINRAQDNYVMFAQCQGVLSMVPELYVAAEAWKTMKKETPELLTLPLRAWLLKHWVDLMLKRMEMIMTSEDTIKQAKDMLILDDQCNVPYLEWNRSSRSLQIKKDRDPMTLSQVLEALKAMQLLAIQPLVVLRFHATRELCQEMKSEVVPLMLQVGSRTAECHQMWNHLQRLSHSAACRVTAVSLRSDRMGRSALGVAVQKIIEEMYGA
ncbi:unnamed protein product [Symbiodinium necroappetens]|uniref:Reverse transcriptase domain-containing protein n=1 Tax=Symbiodinium necroappetens TaxID=1628268 RepID=A0A812PYS9_9DINO|nr:unnamed protein product [Symbiodinium necroappetens]